LFHKEKISETSFKVWLPEFSNGLAVCVIRHGLRYIIFSLWQKNNCMKPTTFRPAAISVLLLIFLVMACDKAPKGDKAEISEKEEAAVPTGQTFAVDTARSWIKFTGHGVGKNHPGTFKLNYGAVAVEHDTVSGGSFVININSMKLEQADNNIQKKLRPHLLSGDFFNANEFKTASFEITNVVPYELEKDAKKSLVEGANFTIRGNLTLKDVTKNVTFPAHIDLDGNTLKADSNFDIDRREWQMNYGNDKTLGNSFISETVNIELHLEAMKAENSAAASSK
jgi:polyisoprenoid-binding protein YceI